VAEVAGEVVAEAVVAVPALEEEAAAVAAVVAAVVWVPESGSTQDHHKSMRRSLGR